MIYIMSNPIRNYLPQIRQLHTNFFDSNRILLLSKSLRATNPSCLSIGRGPRATAPPAAWSSSFSRSQGELRRTDLGPDCSSATLSNFAASESTRKPLLHTRGISRARSFDLEVTPWAPTRLTSCISHPCLLYTSPSPRDGLLSRMPSSA